MCAYSRDLSTFFVRLRARYQVAARAHVGPQIATRYFAIATRRELVALCRLCKPSQRAGGKYKLLPD